MSASGIEIDEELVTKFTDMKTNKKYRHMIMTLQDVGGEDAVQTASKGGKKMKTPQMVKMKHEVKLEGAECGRLKTQAEDKAFFEEMLAVLNGEPPINACYILYDFCFLTEIDKIAVQKMVFIAWSNDNAASIGEKMTYASTTDSVKKKFNGLSHYLQINDKADLDYNSICEIILKKKV